MFLGTHTGVGKHTLCCAILRYLKNKGISVSPFKAVSIDNYTCRLDSKHEISFAQTLQALAAGKKPVVEMNPYVAVYNSTFALMELGKRLTERPDMIQNKKHYLTVIEKSFKKLASESEIVVIEGGGSPVELGLEEIDLANIPLVEIANPKILLVTEMIHGGGYASILGTLSLLPENIRTKVIGIILNKFDINEPKQFIQKGIKRLHELVNLPVMVIPFLNNTFIPDENIYYTIDYENLCSYDNEIDQLARIIVTNLDIDMITTALEINN